MLIYTIIQVSNENQSIVCKSRNSPVAANKPFDALDTEFSDRVEHISDDKLADWIVVRESVLIRPYNTSGVIAYIGKTHFQVSV